MRPPTDQEYLQAYLDGELAPEQAAALEIRLRSDPRVADALMRLAREEAVLTEWGRSTRALSAPDTGDTPSPNLIPFATALPMAPVAKPTHRRRLVLILALSSVAAALVVYFGTSKFKPAPAPVAATDLAQLEEVRGSVHVVTEKGDHVPAHTGQQLASGQKLVTAKTAPPSRPSPTSHVLNSALTPPTAFSRNPVERKSTSPRAP
jgi:anti-sigma factor RsiW